MFNSNYSDEFRQFIPKLFLQNNLSKCNFSQMKNFFDLSRRSDIFGSVKKKYDFCTKNNNSKYLQNTKKIFRP